MCVCVFVGAQIFTGKLILCILMGEERGQFKAVVIVVIVISLTIIKKVK